MRRSCSPQEWAQRDVLRKIGALLRHDLGLRPGRFLGSADRPRRARRGSPPDELSSASCTAPCRTSPVSNHEPQGDYILVTTGGGGDGADLIDNVLSAYQGDDGMPLPGAGGAGPVHADARAPRSCCGQRPRRCRAIDIIEFDNRLENLIAGARAVVGMGGYNTFCEVLSFDKPALMVPRDRAARGAAHAGPARRRARAHRHAAARGGRGSRASWPAALRSARRPAAAVARAAGRSRSTASTTSASVVGDWIRQRSPQRLRVDRGARSDAPSMADKIVVILKGYPRLSETFIAQELLGLERAGHASRLVCAAPARPTANAIRCTTRSGRRSTICPNISMTSRGACCEPGGRCGGSPATGRRGGRFSPISARDRTRNRVRRFGQALVLAAEMPPGASWLHAHFIHTPGLGHGLCEPDDGSGLDLFGPCQGHLDHARMGARARSSRRAAGS